MIVLFLPVAAPVLRLVHDPVMLIAAPIRSLTCSLSFFGSLGMSVMVAWKAAIPGKNSMPQLPLLPWSERSRLTKDIQAVDWTLEV